jgi:hypothetical protein
MIGSNLDMVSCHGNSVQASMLLSFEDHVVTNNQMAYVEWILSQAAYTEEWMEVDTFYTQYQAVSTF